MNASHEALFVRWRSLLAPSEQKLFIGLSVVVGVAAGVSAYLYIRLVHGVQVWSTYAGEGFSFWLLKKSLIVLLPGLGGWLAGSLSQRFADGEKGTATAVIVYRLRRKEGDIPPRFTITKALASAFTIGTGGSAGPEGPATQIGAGLGSFVGQFRHLSREYRKTLVAAGAAAGIAAVFNAPITGVMFSLELLVREFATEAFAMVVLATVTASVTSYLLLGHRVFLNIPTFELHHTWELGFCAILAILSALVSKLFVITFLYIEKTFREFTSIPASSRAMVGGLLVGGIGLFLPQVLGDGHHVVSEIFSGQAGQWSLLLLFAIMIAKIIATSLSLGSGGSGGIFVPTLCFGAMLGAIVGRCVTHFFPFITSPDAYILLGMGAVFAGMTHAPFTAIMLLFEITGDYRIILPLMLTVGITILIAEAIYPDTIESHELRERGVRFHEKEIWRHLDNFTVKDVMTFPVETLSHNLSFAEVLRSMGRSSHTGFPIIDDQTCLVGLLTYHELQRIFQKNEEDPNHLLARDIMQTEFPTAHPDEPLSEVLHRIQANQLDRIIVTDALDDRKVVGVVTKGDILKTYQLPRMVSLPTPS